MAAKVWTLFEHILFYCFQVHDSLDEKLPAQISFENEVKQKCGSLRSVDMKNLPRPPPLPVLAGDLLDAQGYLLPKEVEPPHYLETLPN